MADYRMSSHSINLHTNLHVTVVTVTDWKQVHLFVGLLKMENSEHLATKMK